VLICGSQLCVVRKILVTLGFLVLVVVVILATWIFLGRQISLLVDRLGTIKIASVPIHSVAYEGSGAGGWLTVNAVHLGLDGVNPKIVLSIGSTKDNQFAVASGGKVFALGPLKSTAENGGEYLAVVPPTGDEAFFVTRRSALGWPTPFDFNFMTGHSPSWKRDLYYHLLWKKSSGVTLQMVWRYEQSFYGRELVPGNGWDSGFAVRQGSTGLVRVEIRP
jgi:hypothetical protein